MNAALIVDILLENIDSLEGVPDYDEFLTKAIREPNSEEGRQFTLKTWPPKTKAEAVHLGVNWFIKGGRKYTFSRGTEYPQTYYNSRTMATNRNALGKAESKAGKTARWITRSKRSLSAAVRSNRSSF